LRLQAFRRTAAHTYVLLRRLEGAELMLHNTQLPLSEIAAMGFKVTLHAISTV
jgi:AraC-like DNA-binding protein